MHLFSPLLTMNTPSPSLVQTLPSYLLYNPKVFLWTSIHWLSCQKHGFTCRTFLVPAFLLFLLTLLLLPPCLRSPILLLLSLLLSSFLFVVFSFSFLFSPPISFLLLLFSLFLSVSAILTSLALASTASHILLNISSFLLLLFSSQSQDYGEQATAFPRLCSTFALQLCLSPFFPYIPSDKY